MLTKFQCSAQILDDAISVRHMTFTAILFVILHFFL